MSRLGSLGLLIALVTAAPGVARAGSHRMTSGVYARLGLGSSVMRNLTSVDPSGDAMFETVDFGTGVSFDLQVGGLLDNGLALTIVIAADAAVATSISGKSADLFVPATDLVMGVFGVSLTYYFVPDGPWFINGGLGFGTTNKENGSVSIEEETTTGLATFFGGGWEYPLGERFAFGAMGRIHVNDNIAKDTSHHGVAFSVMGTSSFNWGW